MAYKFINGTPQLSLSYIHVLKWLYRISIKKYISSYKPRFSFLSPPHSSKQFIFDRDKNEKFSLEIRDQVDWGVLEQVFNSEVYSIRSFKRYPDIKAKYDKYLKNNITPIILDIGANSGMVSYYFAKEYPGAKIIGIEPDTSNYNLAVINNHINQNVLVINAGISSYDCQGTIINKSDENVALRTEISETGEVTMVSINSLIKKYAPDNSALFIVKVDIEGFEENLFSQSTEWVNECQLLIIELHDWMLPSQANSSNFLKCISQYNRDFLFSGENVFSIKN